MASTSDKTSKTRLDIGNVGSSTLLIKSDKHEGRSPLDTGDTDSKNLVLAWIVMLLQLIEMPVQ